MVIDYTACYTKGTKINGASLPGCAEKHRELALDKKIHLSCLQHKKTGRKYLLCGVSYGGMMEVPLLALVR